MTTRNRQELGFSLTVTTEGDADPKEYATNLLSAPGVQVVDSWVDSAVEVLPEVNRKRLVAVAAWAAGEDAKRRLGLPNEWRQASYFTRLNASGGVAYDAPETACGTACCIAGRVAQEDGAVPLFEGFYTTPTIMLPDGTETTADAYATETLGLTAGQSTNLFNGSNELDDVLRIVAELVGTELQD